MEGFRVHGSPQPPTPVHREWLPTWLPHTYIVYIVAIPRYRALMTKQTTVRLPEDLADDAETVARVKGTSVNALIVEALRAEIERVRQDEDFTSRAKRLLERDRELMERLAR